jgi:hypothetical protein
MKENIVTNIILLDDIGITIPGLLYFKPILKKNNPKYETIDRTIECTTFNKLIFEKSVRNMATINVIILTI